MIMIMLFISFGCLITINFNPSVATRVAGTSH